MDSSQKLQDCYFFFYSSCNKGAACPFRHSPAALGSEIMCKFWLQGKCTQVHCQYRHMLIEKRRDQIPCYWETQPGGCQKPHCPFMHKLKTGSPSSAFNQGQQIQMEAIHISNDGDATTPDSDDNRVVTQLDSRKIVSVPSPVQPVLIQVTPEKSLTVRNEQACKPSGVAVRSLQELRVANGVGRGWRESTFADNKAPERTSALQRLSSRRDPVHKRLGVAPEDRGSLFERIGTKSGGQHAIVEEKKGADLINTLKRTAPVEQQPYSKKKRDISPIRFHTNNTEPKPFAKTAVVTRNSVHLSQSVTDERAGNLKFTNASRKTTTSTVRIKTLDEILAEKRQKKQSSTTSTQPAVCSLPQSDSDLSTNAPQEAQVEKKISEEEPCNVSENQPQPENKQAENGYHCLNKSTDETKTTDDKINVAGSNNVQPDTRANSREISPQKINNRRSTSLSLDDSMADCPAGPVLNADDVIAQIDDLLG